MVSQKISRSIRGAKGLEDGEYRYRIMGNLGRGL